MFVDWTDFSVEHMSKWWRLLNITNDQDPNTFNAMIDVYNRYLQKVETTHALWSSYDHIHQSQGEPALKHAIGMISYQPIMDASYKERGRKLAVSSLAGTIASLYQVGFGRIVVIGYREEDQTDVQNAFRIVDSTFRNNNKGRTGEMVQNTELSYIRITRKEWVFTRHISVHVIRASIIGMQHALAKKLNSTETQEWLGTKPPEYWKYVFLSEPDTILHTKPWLLVSLACM